MLKWFSNILAETKPQGRATFRFARVIFGVTIINAFIYSYIYGQNSSPQLSAIISANFVLTLAMVFSAVLAWDNRHLRAVEIIIYGISLFAIFIVGLISGLGLILSISIFVFALAISGQTLTIKEAPRVLMISLGFAIIALVGDLFIPWKRLSLPLIQTATTYLVVIILLLQALRIIGLFPGYSLRTKLTTLLVGSALAADWKDSSDTSSFVRQTQNNAMAIQLREFKIYYPEFKGALITDRNGAIIAATDRSADYYQPSHQVQ